jgi:predicted dehydrogenase
MVERLRVGIVGAGKRVASMYVPVLESMQSQIEVVGHVRQTDRESHPTLGPRVGTFTELLQRGAKVFIVVTPPQLLEDTIRKSLEQGVHVLSETPVYTAGLVALARERGVWCGVVEQKPFVPIMEFARQILDTGELGTVCSIINNFGGYEYHGVACLRMLSGLKGRPAGVVGVARRVTVDGAIPSGAAAPPVDEILDFGVISFANGSTAVHLGSCFGGRLPYRTRGTFSVLGTRGTLVIDPLGTIELRTQTSSGLFLRSTVATLTPNNTTATLSIELQAGKQLTWSNPSPQLTNDQVGIQRHLSELIRTAGTAPLYDVSEALLDTALLQQLRKDGIQPIHAR